MGCWERFTGGRFTLMADRRVSLNVSQLPPGIERRGDRRYRGHYRAGGKVRATATFSTVRDAVAALEAAKVDARRGEVEHPTLTLAEWWRQWSVTRDVAPRTAAADRGRWTGNIEPYLGGRVLAGIEQDDIRAWLARLQREGKTDQTRAKALTLLKTMLGKHGAVGARVRRSNPCDGVVVKAAQRAAEHTPEEVWRILTRDEADKLLGAAEGPHLPAVMLALYAGLRWGEIAHLRPDDYDGNALRIQRVTAKSRRTRLVPVHSRLADVLDRSADTWLVPIGGPRRHHSTFDYHWRKITAAADLHGLRFHDLRHTCASWLVNEAGASLAIVRDIMGHSSITTTEKYLHSDHSQRSAAIGRL